MRLSVLTAVAHAGAALAVAIAFVASGGFAPAPSASTASTGTAPECGRPSPGQVRCFAEFRKIGSRTILGSGGRKLAPEAATNTLPADFAGYTPAELASAYGLAASTTAATVAVVDAYRDPAAATDLATYRARYGLPACTAANGCLRSVNQSGATTPLPTGVDSSWSGETDLDLDMVSAICASCHILLVETDDTDSLFTGVATAARLGARYVSMSWGAGDWSGAPAYTSAYFAAKGVAYVAASGDSGYGADFPAASPDVVAVGGTTLAPANTSRGWAETVWNNDNGWATASGCSANSAKPAWQSIIAASTCTTRATNDVAVDADPNTGLSVYSSAEGGWVIAGGTSAGAPMVAAMYARSGAPSTTQYSSAAPYAHRSLFNDITSGSDGSCAPAVRCTAGAGWDGPTGLGSPIGSAAFAPVAGPPVLTMHNPGTVRTNIGIAATVSVVASGASGPTYSARGLPAGVRITSSGVITGTPVTSATYRVTVTASKAGAVSASVAFAWVLTPNRIITSSTPRLTGVNRAGRAVAVSLISWRRNSVTGSVIDPTVHYQWYLNGVAIKGATRSIYLPPTADRGRVLQVHVSAAQPYYTNYLDAFSVRLG